MKIANKLVSHSKRGFSTGAEQPLLQPYQLGPFNLKNRIAVGGLTRLRCDKTGPNAGVPTDLLVEHYRLRAKDAGIYFTEAIAVNQEGNGYVGCGLLDNEKQLDGWKRVIEACKKEGGILFAQLQHSGRATHSIDAGCQPISSSAIPVEGDTYVHTGEKVPFEVPRPMTKDDIKRVYEVFREKSNLSIKIGFDGVQIHGATSYIFDQFMKDGVNQRTDEYGGSVENRSRFTVDLMDLLVRDLGSARVGLKISPVHPFNSMSDSDPVKLYDYLIPALSRTNMGHLMVMEGFRDDYTNAQVAAEFFKDKTWKSWPERYRKQFKGTWIANHGYEIDSANDVIQKGLADLVSFGRFYIANHDVAHRIRSGIPLRRLENVTDWSLFKPLLYAQSDWGYNDLTPYDPKPQQ